ncbi:MAG: hydroxysqualene dehydroxylase HpnE [Alphaproteobacteria bacterium]
MTEPHVHIIGAGLAGLSAALHLSQAVRNITVYEAAGHAGGRCRSYFDRELGCRIDNGNHLMLSGNVIARDYLMLAGAEDTLAAPDRAVFPFMDLRSGERWTLEMSRGIIPWNLFTPKGRIPGTSLSDYLSLIKVMRAGEQETVAGLTRSYGTIYERFWEPLSVAVLNTPPETGSARLLGNVLSQTFALGGSACLPLVPKIGLSESFVDPCIAKLQSMGIQVRLNRRLREMSFKDGRIAALDFGDGAVECGAEDWVILAVPPWVAQELVPDLTAPNEFCSILNLHYRADIAVKPPGFAGLIGGVAEWIFVKPGVVSVTVSAADRYDGRAPQDLAAAIWRDVAAFYRLDGASIPPYRIVKEKRATFAATPAQQARRPKARGGRYLNLLLAGDWTQNELPSTIEGSIRSGLRAAQIITRWMGVSEDR